MFCVTELSVTVTSCEVTKETSTNYNPELAVKDWVLLELPIPNVGPLHTESVIVETGHEERWGSSKPSRYMPPCEQVALTPVTGCQTVLPSLSQCASSEVPSNQWLGSRAAFTWLCIICW